MKAVLFDLLSALIDSWSLWDDIAASEERGRRWRFEYLRLTYGTGAYVPYLDLVEESAAAVGLPRGIWALRDPPSRHPPYTSTRLSRCTMRPSTAMVGSHISRS